MDIREATAADIESIQSIAHQSLQTSYTFLSEWTIEEAVGSWYDPETLQAAIERPEELLIVAAVDATPEGEREVVAFSQSELIGGASEIGHIGWLHVHPAHRGHGTGSRLLVHTREALLAAGADRIRTVVVTNNEHGNQFYANHGFEQVDSRPVKIGGDTYIENVYAETDLGSDDPDSWRALEATATADQTVYVSYGEATRGSDAPFYATYEDERGDRRYGWFCGQCESSETAMDSMGRIQCTACGNHRKPTRWDAAYL